MVLSLKHAFQSAKTDGADNTLVQPSNWNADHTLTGSNNILFGTNGTGAGGEITVSTGLSLSSSVLSVAIGTNVQAWDGDLDAIAALAGTSGFLKKTAANTWTLDTNTYITGISSGTVTTALGFTPENAANKGQANGYASLDSGGKVPSAQLPSYVDDVLEYNTQGSFPATGSTGVIYVALDSNKIYRWSGSAYVEISPSPGSTDGVTEGTTNLYFTNARARGAISATGSSLTYNSSTGVFSTDADLDAIAALAGTSGLLKKTAADTWTLDTASYLASSAIGATVQAWDADLDAIAAIAGTTGLLKKTAANTWSLDTTSYLSGSIPISTGVSGLGTGVATFLATPSSENLASAITDETGSGSVVFATSPTLTTPRLAGSSTGYTSFASSNSSATNYTVTFPAETMTVGFRNIPAVGTKTSSYTLAVGDVGKYVQVGSSGSITVPDATFAEGDVITVFNNTTGNITITCSITTAYIAGTNTDKATMTLATRGVATILFISGTVCVVSGNVT